MHRKPLYFPFKDDRMIYKADMADKVMAFDVFLHPSTEFLTTSIGLSDCSILFY